MDHYHDYCQKPIITQNTGCDWVKFRSSLGIGIKLTPVTAQQLLTARVRF